MKRQTFMNPSHPRWREFCERLEGPDGCNFREKTPGDPDSITWTCGGGMDKTFAAAILKKMGFSELAIEASLAYFEAYGGHCDCEILFNVESRSKGDR